MGTSSTSKDELGWDEHRRAQLDSWCKATPAQRLAWLEDAIRLAHEAGALPRTSRPSGE